MKKQHGEEKTRIKPIDIFPKEENITENANIQKESIKLHKYKKI